MGLKELEEQQLTIDRDHWNAFELRDQRPRAVSARKPCTALERQLVQDKPQEPGARKHWTKMERLMEAILQRGSGSTGQTYSPSAVPYSGLYSGSIASQDSIAGQIWTDPEQELMENSVQGVSGNLLEMVAQFAKPELTGDNLPARLAVSINYMSLNQLQGQALIDTMGRHLQPGNCKSLNVPTVNACIWKHVGASNRTRDVLLQKVLKTLNRRDNSIHTNPG